MTTTAITPVVATPVVATPVVATPVVATPVVATPVVATPVVPPKSYASYPGVFYIDPETKKPVRSLTTSFLETKSYAAKSPISGYGCFSKKEIKSGEMIEECSAILLDTTTKSNTDWVITQYMFTWPCEQEDPVCKENGSTFFVPTGNALLYNHSDTPNTYWIYDRSMKRIFLAALRDIKENEELTWYYGHGYAKRLRDGTAGNPGGCKPCEQRQKELEEKRKLQENLQLKTNNEATLLASPPVISPTNINNFEGKKKELMDYWIDKKNKEKIANTPIEFRSMVVPENKINDNIQDG